LRGHRILYDKGRRTQHGGAVWGCLLGSNQANGLNDMRAGFPFGVLLAGLLAVVLSGVGGCATVEGLGQDIQRGGEAIERAADRNRSD